MFNNLPGKVTPYTGDELCEFYTGDYIIAIKEMVEANKASEELKATFLKGEDYECDSPATVRIQGETDSFGAEYSHHCAACAALVSELAEYQQEQTAEELCDCDWCRREVPRKELRHTRDIDEGSNGPVYEVCSACRKKQAEQIQEQLDYLD